MKSSEWLTVEKVRKDLTVSGVHITYKAGGQYGGQASHSVRRNGIFFYSVPDRIVHELETDGVIDCFGNPVSQGEDMGSETHPVKY